MNTRIALIVTLLSLLLSKETRAKGRCVFNPNENKEIFHLRPQIAGLEYTDVHPAQVLSKSGIFVLCYYKNANGTEQIPKIRGFKFSLIRNGTVYRTGVSKSAYFDKDFIDAVSDVLEDDSLIIFNIDVTVNSNSEEVSVTKFKNFIIDTIKVRFTHCHQKVSPEERGVSGALFKNKTFKRLTDVYASDATIDANFSFIYFWYDPRTKLFSRQYTLGFREAIDYDLTFEVSKVYKIVYVIDNIRKKRMTLQQWEKMMSKFK